MCMAFMCIYQDEIEKRIKQLGPFPHVKLVDKDLADIASMMTNPFTLAPHLDIRNPQLENLKRDYPTHNEQKYQMLCLWRRKLGSRATLNSLVKILCEQDQVNLAEEILDHFINKCKYI